MLLVFVLITFKYVVWGLGVPVHSMYVEVRTTFESWFSDHVDTKD